MASQDRYLRHAAGITSLLGWLTRWDRYPDAYTQVDASVTLSEFPSRRFSVGVPKKRSFGKYPFLALQADEMAWVGAIDWNRAVVRDGGRELILVAQRCVGDGEHVPDLPAFSVSLAFDLAEKAEIMALSPRLEARGLWFEDGDSRVANGSPTWSIPLVRIKANDPIMTADEIAVERSFRDLVRDQLNRTSMAVNPGYTGDAVELTKEQREWL